MKISFKLALSYLKKQKGRSLALITSISLAVILVFALNVIPETQSQLNIKEAYKNFSDYHVEYTDLDKNTVDKLSSDKDVSELDGTLNLGNIVDKNGVSTSLNSYNSKFIDAYGYKLIKGHEPKGENEIVLEEKALKEMGISNKLNSTIDFTVIKKYVDKNNQNQVYSKKIGFKLVGIIQKPDGYYENNEYYKVKGFVDAKQNNNILPKELVGYNGVLKFKSKNPSISLAYKKIAEYNLNDYNFMVNVSLTEVLDEYEMSRNTQFSMNNKIIPMIAAGLVIYNIFNIILIEMTKQIGMLRAIGLSKKKVKYMLLIQGLIVLIIGLVFGYILGLLFSVIGLSTIYGHLVKLYISKASILETTIMASIAVAVSMIFIIYKSGKISPIEAIKFTNKTSKSKKNRFYHKMIRKTFGMTFEMAFRNLSRNKSRTIVSVLSIGLAGMLFISKMAVYNNNESLDNTSMLTTTMGDSNVILSKDGMNTDNNFAFFSKNDIDQISKIKGITNIEKSTNFDGYLKTDANRLEDEYKSSNAINSDNKDIEVDLKVKAYEHKGLDNLNKFIEDGSNINDKSTDKYPSVLISNHYYFPQIASNDAKVLKDIKVNDLIDIKIPVNKDGKLEYINQKVRVKGILDKDYVLEHNSGMDGSIQVILNQNDCKNLVNSLGYNKIALSVEKSNEDRLVKKIEEITKDSSFAKVISKYQYHKTFEENDLKNKKEVLVSVVLTLLISSINIICIIRTNIMLRINEISTLRAIGMSIKKVKNMIIKESLIYGVLSIIIASVVSTLDYYKFISMVRETQQQIAKNSDLVSYNIPFIEIIQFSVVTILICLFAVYLSKSKIENLSIVEGIRDNE